MSDQELALFPLSTIAFPGGRLPLRIFEPRYTDMVARCMRADECFGVCLLRQGRETGESGEPHDVGVAMRIVDFDRLDDGFLGIEVSAERRFRVVDRWREPDGLWVGRVNWLPDDPAGVVVPRELEPLAELLGHCYERLSQVPARPWRMDDASWLSGRLIEVLPLATGVLQALLEEDDPATRLRQIANALQALRRA